MINQLKKLLRINFLLIHYLINQLINIYNTFSAKYTGNFFKTWQPKFNLITELYNINSLFINH